VLSISEVKIIVGCIVRVRCRRKKFTFAISSPDEFLVTFINVKACGCDSLHRITKFSFLLFYSDDR